MQTPLAETTKSLLSELRELLSYQEVYSSLDSNFLNRIQNIYNYKESLSEEQIKHSEDYDQTPFEEQSKTDKRSLLILAHNLQSPNCTNQKIKSGQSIVDSCATAKISKCHSLKTIQHEKSHQTRHFKIGSLNSTKQLPKSRSLKALHPETSIKKRTKNQKLQSKPLHLLCDVAKKRIKSTSLSDKGKGRGTQRSQKNYLKNITNTLDNTFTHNLGEGPHAKLTHKLQQSTNNNHPKKWVPVKKVRGKRLATEPVWEAGNREYTDTVNSVNSLLNANSYQRPCLHLQNHEQPQLARNSHYSIESQTQQKTGNDKISIQEQAQSSCTHHLFGTYKHGKHSNGDPQLSLIGARHSKQSAIRQESLMGTMHSKQQEIRQQKSKLSLQIAELKGLISSEKQQFQSTSTKISHLTKQLEQELSSAQPIKKKKIQGHKKLEEVWNEVKILNQCVNGIKQQQQEVTKNLDEERQLVGMYLTVIEELKEQLKIEKSQRDQTRRRVKIVKKKQEANKIKVSNTSRVNYGIIGELTRNLQKWA